MTVIAWDGKMLAADKMASNCGVARTVTKIFKHGGELFAFSGKPHRGHEMMDWVLMQKHPATFPANTDGDDSFTILLRITGSQILVYEDAAFPMVVEDKHFTMGSGRDYAEAALHLGLGAVRAVEVACALDLHCGNGIDTLEF